MIPLLGICSEELKTVISTSICAPVFRATLFTVAKCGSNTMCYMKGEPLPELKSGLLSNTRKWIVRGHTHTDKARGFIGKGHLGGVQEGKGAQEDCSATLLTASSFTIMSWFLASLANHSDRVFPGGVCNTQPREIPAKKDSGKLVKQMDWNLFSPFDLSQILPVGGSQL